MSILIADANKCLEAHGMAVQLGIEQEARFRQNNYGLQYDSSESVRAVFQLVEKEKVIVQHPVWAVFLDLIQDEFGSRFMRETGLDKLVFPKRREDE
jgi:hypothetical protein